MRTPNNVKGIKNKKVQRITLLMMIFSILVGSITGEIQATSLSHSKDEKANKVDIVFVVDTGYTMKKKLHTVKRSIKEIIRLLQEEYQLDVEVSIIDFKDINALASEDAIRINGNRVSKAEGVRALSFTKDQNKIENILKGLEASGGYATDITGTPLAGLGYVTTMPFRKEAGRFTLLMTDKAYNISNCHGYKTVNQLLDELRQKEVNLGIAYMPYHKSGDQTEKFYKRWLNHINGMYSSMKDLSDSEYEVAEFIVTNLIGEKEFMILKDTGLVKITLKAPLTKGGSICSDQDALTDSEEVNWDLIKFENGEFQLPTVSYLWQWPGVVYDIKAIESTKWFKEGQEIKVLPIISDPTSEDGDQDGLKDEDDKYPLFKRRS